MQKWLRNPNTELVALCDVKPREELGIEAYDVPFFDDYKQMLELKMKLM